MSETKRRESWRCGNTHFVEVGRSLNEIERAMGLVGATGLIDDRSARYELQRALKASRHMTEHLKRLIYAVKVEAPE